MKEHTTNHTLDYPTLERWGFTWVFQKEIKGHKTVHLYGTKIFFNTHTGEVCHLTLRVANFDRADFIWELQYFGEKKYIDTLFRGLILNEKFLQDVLAACIIDIPKFID